MVLVQLLSPLSTHETRPGSNIDSRGNEKLDSPEGRWFVREDRRSTLSKRLIASDVAGIFGNDTACLSRRLFDDNAPFPSLLLFPVFHQKLRVKTPLRKNDTLAERVDIFQRMSIRSTGIDIDQ